MDDQPGLSAPPILIESLEASVRDLAAGTVSDAGDVQAEMRRMPGDHERMHLTAGPTSKRPGAV